MKSILIVFLVSIINRKKVVHSEIKDGEENKKIKI